MTRRCRMCQCHVLGRRCCTRATAPWTRPPGKTWKDPVLMAQKSGIHQLKVGSFFPYYLEGFGIHLAWGFLNHQPSLQSGRPEHQLPSHIPYPLALLSRWFSLSLGDMDSFLGGYELGAHFTPVVGVKKKQWNSHVSWGVSYNLKLHLQPA